MGGIHAPVALVASENHYTLDQIANEDCVSALPVDLYYRALDSHLKVHHSTVGYQSEHHVNDRAYEQVSYFQATSGFVVETGCSMFLVDCVLLLEKRQGSQNSSRIRIRIRIRRPGHRNVVEPLYGRLFLDCVFGDVDLCRHARGDRALEEVSLDCQVGYLTVELLALSVGREMGRGWLRCKSAVSLL